MLVSDCLTRLSERRSRMYRCELVKMKQFSEDKAIRNGQKKRIGVCLAFASLLGFLLNGSEATAELNTLGGLFSRRICGYVPTAMREAIGVCTLPYRWTGSSKWRSVTCDDYFTLNKRWDGGNTHKFGMLSGSDASRAKKNRQEAWIPCNELYNMVQGISVYESRSLGEKRSREWHTIGSAEGCRWKIGNTWSGCRLLDKTGPHSSCFTNDMIYGLWKIFNPKQIGRCDSKMNYFSCKAVRETIMALATPFTD